MKVVRRAPFPLVLALAAALAAEPAHGQARNVVVNGARLTDGQVTALQRQYGEDFGV